MTFARDNLENFKRAVSVKITDLEKKADYGRFHKHWQKTHDILPKILHRIRWAWDQYQEWNSSLKAEKDVLLEKSVLAKVLSMATIREGVSISLIVSSGLGPELPGNIKGLNDLVRGDILDLKVGDRKVTYVQVPL